ncbi:SusC/RagA family TonB-linked outer membrane protein [Rudanella lutea]|uniref:SusC/RagA family TonB-linked outer membrane protein n=1 Tax=Rudanella lutea TaxID=451374 RepID=UPI0004805DE3|nr:TonB-dependent receptor [Rudanella lutea]
MRTLAYILTGLWLVVCGRAYAQDQQVTGRVVSKTDGQGLPGVSVLVKGTTTGTATDANGDFQLNVPSGAVLQFSMIGMTSQEVPVGNQTVINVQLADDARALEEVVVVGYGTQRKIDVTGSVAQVKGEELARQPVLSATQALQSKVSGVQIINSGAPGQAPTVRIRGTGTLLGGADPLYVVDGIITEDIRNINTADITSVDVLKDASATAIYGVRAANGVVLITTRRGKTGAPSVTYDGYVGIRTPAYRVRMADSELFATYSNEAVRYDNPTAPLPFDPATAAATNTDWFKAITRTGFQQNHALSVSGGTDRSTYLFSAGYFTEKGILKGSDYNRLTLRLNNEYTLTPAFKLGHNLSLANDNSNLTGTSDPALPSTAAFSAFTNAYKQAPTVPVRNADGTYGFTSRNNVANPVAQLDYTNYRSRGLRLQGSFYGNLTVFKKVTLLSNFGIESNGSRAYTYNPVYQVSSNQRNLTSTLNTGRSNSARWLWTNTAEYNNTFAEKHTVKILAGYVAERFQDNILSAARQDVPPQSNYFYLNTGNASTATNSESGSIQTRQSYIGRVNYNYSDRYLLTATARYDGSSKFPTNNRWGFFPSVGVGWVLSEEPFLRGKTPFDQLKARVSWGKTGNDRISPSAFLYTIASGLDYAFGANQTLQQGRTITNLIDPNLRWEVTTGTDIGLEFALARNRLTGELTYYNKRTTDALFTRPIDAIFGDVDGSYLTNAASVRNRGFEFALNWRNNATNGFSYNVGVNATINRNQLEDVQGGLPINEGGLGNGQFTTRTAVGQPIGSFWVWQTDGIFQTQEEVNNTRAKVQGTKPGDFRYVDQNGDGVIDDNDRVFVGSYQPKLYFGVNGGFTYRNFDFSTDWYANFGNKVYNGKKAQRFGNENIEASRADRWTPTNPSTTEPRASNAVPIASTYYVESGSFFRVNNVTLGYTLPRELVSSLKVSRVRFYVTAQNALTIKAFSGYTPELPGSNPLNAGVELSTYPVTSAYLAGLNIGF